MHTVNGPRASVPGRCLFGLFLLGLALRLPGLLFNGMSDLYEMLLDWGAKVHHLGLVDAFGINYGILSYACFGVAETAAEWIPRFWWAPYKLLVISFDAAACLALLALAAPRDRRKLMLLVWLNPWFVLHGAYHGFWEGPHILFGVLAILALQRIHNERRAWAVAGALIMCSAMFKPQGMLHFAVPLGLFLGVHYLRGARRPLVSFAAGIGAIAVAASASIWMAGGSAWALFDNFRSASTSMPNLSNGGPGLWRFLSWLYMASTGQHGQVYDLEVSRTARVLWEAVAGVICLGTVLAFALRVGVQRGGGDHAPHNGVGRRLMRAEAAHWPAWYVALAFLTLGALVVSQFGPHAHINHTYAAMVLLSFWVIRDAGLARFWAAMAVMLGVAHFSVFRLGEARIMLPMEKALQFPEAAALIERVIALPAHVIPDALLTIQASANRLLLPTATAISMMSVLVFVATCGILRRLFHVLNEPTRPCLPGK